MLAAPEGTSEVDYYMDKRFGNSYQAHFAPGTIAPGDTWGAHHGYSAGILFDQPQPPMTSIYRVVITDAPGAPVWALGQGWACPAYPAVAALAVEKEFAA